MKGTLILADAVSVHQDGTFSMLRGGINSIEVKENEPKFFQGALLVRLHAKKEESGPHAITVVCLKEDGTVVLDMVKETFTVLAEKGFNFNGVVNLQMKFPDYGKYEFRASDGDAKIASWFLLVKVPGKKEAATKVTS